MLVSIIVATDEHGAIGRDGGLPWRLPDDLRRFKSLTLDKPVVMGRKTWDSIGKPLPGRHNIVITRDAQRAFDGATVVTSLPSALAAAGAVDETCIIGGAEIYRLALPRTDVIHLTRVHATVAADTFFPPLVPGEWEDEVLERHAADERHEFSFSYVVQRRRR